MSRRDLACRAAGAVLIAAAAAAGTARPGNPGLAATLALCAFLLAMGGLVLLVEGDRLRRAPRVGRSRQLPIALSVGRHARRRGTGPSRPGQREPSLARGPRMA